MSCADDLTVIIWIMIGLLDNIKVEEAYMLFLGLTNNFGCQTTLKNFPHIGYDTIYEVIAN